jgi:hypothetical protein
MRGCRIYYHLSRSLENMLGEFARESDVPIVDHNRPSAPMIISI